VKKELVNVFAEERLDVFSLKSKNCVLYEQKACSETSRGF